MEKGIFGTSTIEQRKFEIPHQSSITYPAPKLIVYRKLVSS